MSENRLLAPSQPWKGKRAEFEIVLGPAVFCDLSLAGRRTL
jgi:hypothetical protein